MSQLEKNVVESEFPRSKPHIGILSTPHNMAAVWKIMDLVEQYTPYENIHLLHSEEWNDEVDMIVIPGGADIQPDNGIGSFSRQQKSDHFVTYFMERRASFYLKRGVRLFGICAGFQALGIYCGIPIRPHFDGHQLAAVHKATTVPNDVVKNMPSQCNVNSRHHQGFFMEDIPVKAPVVPLVQFNRVLEAFITVEGDIAGVQWHPEDHLNTVDSNDLTGTEGKLIGDVYFHKIFSHFLNLIP